MSVFAVMVLLTLGLCILGAIAAWALHWHQLSRAIENYGRHSHAAVHK